MIENAVNNKKNVIDLLESENLPVKDLPLSLKNFFLVRDNAMAIGVVGLEIYGRYGLLRSLLVKEKIPQ